MREFGVDGLGTILSVWAHPDDETYLAGALMARAVASGSRVVCVTATRGELGSTDEERWPPGEALAAVRTVEMEHALAELGVTEHHWLDYPDGGLVAVDQAAAVQRLARLVGEVGPDTVLTFGPEGMTGHPDHQAVSRWTTEAVAAAGKDPGIVHHATHSPDWLAEYRAPLDEVGAFMGSEPPCTEIEQMSISWLADGDALHRKDKAIRRQVSQIESIVALMGEDFIVALAEECYWQPQLLR